MKPPSRQFAPKAIGFAVLLVITFAAPVGASNIETGEPCNIGVTTGFERSQAAWTRLLWAIPPASLLLLSGLAAILLFFQRRDIEPGNVRRRLGAMIGVSFAIMTVSGLALALVLVAR